MRQIKNNRGITLIALVVTIVVLLILVGVNIATFIGENGILSNASSTKENEEIRREKESIKLAILNEKIESTTKEAALIFTEEGLQKTLDNQIGENNVEVEKIGDNLAVLFTESERYYQVEKDGAIKYLGKEELLNCVPVQDGLILRYDGIQNTRNGSNPDATIWEDLSGNNNDAILGKDNSFDRNSCVFKESAQSGLSIDNPLRKQKPIDGFTIECLVKSNTTETSTNESFALYDWLWEMRSTASTNKYWIQNIRSYTGNYTIQGIDRTGNEWFRYAGENKDTQMYESQIVISNNETKFFENGELVETQASSQEIIQGIIDDNAKLDIGCANAWNKTSLKLDGNVYAFRVYNEALTDKEVKGNYKLDRIRFDI